MIIHQIFLKVSNKTINDYPCYLEGSALWQEFCSKNGWEYRLHTEIDESIMTEEELEHINMFVLNRALAFSIYSFWMSLMDDVALWVHTFADQLEK